jgi:hypothetical protein
VNARKKPQTQTSFRTTAHNHALREYAQRRLFAQLSAASNHNGTIDRPKLPVKPVQGASHVAFSICTRSRRASGGGRQEPKTLPTVLGHQKFRVPKMSSDGLDKSL